MSELRKIQVSTRRIEPFVGYFHQWFSKVYDDGSSRLYAIIEKEGGQVGVISPFLGTFKSRVFD